MECPYCEATMIDMTADIDRTGRLVLVCLECGYTQEATREGVKTLKPVPSLLREKGNRLLRKAEEVEECEVLGIDTKEEIKSDKKEAEEG